MSLMKRIAFHCMCSDSDIIYYKGFFGKAKLKCPNCKTTLKEKGKNRFRVIKGRSVPYGYKRFVLTEDQWRIVFSSEEELCGTHVYALEKIISEKQTFLPVVPLLKPKKEEIVIFTSLKTDLSEPRKRRDGTYIERIDFGNLTLTNQRLIFRGERNLEVPYSKILKVKFTNDGFSLTRAGKQKKEYFSWESEPIMFENKYGTYLLPLEGCFMGKLISVFAYAEGDFEYLENIDLMEIFNDEYPPIEIDYC